MTSVFIRRTSAHRACGRMLYEKRLSCNDTSPSQGMEGLSEITKPRESGRERGAGRLNNLDLGSRPPASSTMREWVSVESHSNLL